MKKYSNLDKTKKHNIAYKTVQNDGHYYYGRHSTNDLKDGYIGSGTEIKPAIKKFGKSSFSCTILEDFPTYEQSYDYERYLITQEMIDDPMCYNNHPGGGGGLQWNKDHPRYKEITEKISNTATIP